MGYHAELSECRPYAESIGEVVNAALGRMLVAMAVPCGAANEELKTQWQGAGLAVLARPNERNGHA
jgi:hypothetical protein